MPILLSKNLNKNDFKINAETAGYNDGIWGGCIRYPKANSLATAYIRGWRLGFSQFRANNYIAKERGEIKCL